MATKAMVSLGDRCLFGLFVSVALCEGCSEQSERRKIFSRVRRCGVPSVEDKPLWERVCYGSVGVLWYIVWYAGIVGGLSTKNSPKEDCWAQCEFSSASLGRVFSGRYG